MYMTSSLGSVWNSLRPLRPRATKAMVSGVCQRMRTGFTVLRTLSPSSARLIPFSSVMGFLSLSIGYLANGDLDTGRRPHHPHRGDDRGGELPAGGILLRIRPRGAGAAPLLAG